MRQIVGPWLQGSPLLQALQASADGKVYQPRASGHFNTAASRLQQCCTAPAELHALATNNAKRISATHNAGRKVHRWYFYH